MVKELLFYQGETDARYNANWQEWPDKFRAYVESLRKDSGKDFPVVFAQLGQWEKTFPNWDSFKSMQESISMQGVRMIKTDDLPTVDGEHHGPKENEEIGRRFFNSLMELSQKGE